MKILIVDDNPHVLALIQRSLEKHGQVESFHDATDALLRALDSPPDLIVSDYRMQGMDGRQFLEKLRARPQTKKIPVILVATKTDIEERLEGLAEQVEDFVPKPFFVRDLVQRAKRTLDKIFLEKRQAEAESSAGASGVIRGRLSEMNIMDLFQSLEQGSKTCCLTLADGQGESAQIYFGDGQIYHAVMGPVVGDAVINKAVHWNEGTFEINFNTPRVSQNSTSTGTQSLLMEALRLMDEENR